ncbi:cytochrome-c peroxidase [Aestuariicella hydrocarbonica]|uniref:Cytochrome-c peroxidase n=1 Tax=Pseudomaricurvus hydrocarbonicus TaxID=1470433 RepID=A0A9E5MGN5_9GAMM|nr:cytochrome c peroxidase [Aestuariicella hydrocarbonica]NHO64926.1 cytochrome-c peroxidase [Aestuariicella hydrocarbonica]
MTAQGRKGAGWTVIPLGLLGLWALLSAVVGASPPADTVALDPPRHTERWRLSEHCPPGFERTINPKTQAYRCELRSVYQFYDSTQNRGVGGTQTGLPAYRDGFSPQQIDLGRYLFFDPALSGDGTVACASCHQPDKGFADGMALSVGVKGQLGKRSAPTLWNSAFLSSLFWDARADSLEQQARGPLYAADEMGNTEAHLLATLTGIPAYQTLFAQAFPQAGGITLEAVYTSLAAFQSSLISLNSRYDQYAHGNHAALNADEIAGLNVFRSFVARCSECHTPPLFTNNQIAVIGTPEPEGRPLDVGAEATFHEKKLKGGFKVPTLRNIELTAPYMHSGAFSTLREATEFYNDGRGHAVPEGVEMQLHWHIWEPNLTSAELDLIVSFMKTLTDETFKPSMPAALPSGLILPLPSPESDKHPQLTLTEPRLKPQKEK